MSQLLDAVSGVLNAYEPVPGLITGGQPLPEHLAALKVAGCDVVVDVRDPMEDQPIDAPAAVRAAGLDYLNIPVSHTPLDDTRPRRHAAGPAPEDWHPPRFHLLQLR